MVLMQGKGVSSGVAKGPRHCQELCANKFADSGWMRSASSRGNFQGRLKIRLAQVV